MGAVVAGAAVMLDGAGLGGGSAPTLLRAAVGDGQREAVSAHLRETLNDPDFDVVEWSDSLELNVDARDAAHRRSRQAFQEESDRRLAAIRGGARAASLPPFIERPLLSAATGAAARDAPLHIQPLRFRARNGFGAKVLATRYFFVSDGAVVASVDLDDVSEPGLQFLLDLRAGEDFIADPTDPPTDSK